MAESRRVGKSVLKSVRARIQQGPIYTKRRRQCCDNSAMMLVILFSLKTMESFENGL